MLSTFNCGIGLVTVVSADAADAVIAAFRDAGEQAFIIGSLTGNDGGESQVRFSGHSSSPHHSLRPITKIRTGASGGSSGCGMPLRRFSQRSSQAICSRRIGAQDCGPNAAS